MHRMIDLENNLRSLEVEFEKKNAEITNIIHTMSCRIDGCVLEIKFDLPYPTQPRYTKGYRIKPEYEAIDTIHTALFVVFESEKNYVAEISDKLYDFHNKYYIEVSSPGSISDAVNETTKINKVIKIIRPSNQFNLQWIEEDLVKIVDHMTEILKLSE